MNATPLVWTAAALIACLASAAAGASVEGTADGAIQMADGLCDPVTPDSPLPAVHPECLPVAAAHPDVPLANDPTHLE